MATVHRYINSFVCLQISFGLLSLSLCACATSPENGTRCFRTSNNAALGRPNTDACAEHIYTRGIYTAANIILEVKSERNREKERKCRMYNLDEVRVQNVYEYPGIRQCTKDINKARDLPHRTWSDKGFCHHIVPCGTLSVRCRGLAIVQTQSTITSRIHSYSIQARSQ